MEEFSQTLPFLMTNFGTWWGTGNREKKASDIDVVADNKQQSKALLCECKWRNEPIYESEIQKLLGKFYLLSEYSEYHFMFFSKSAYTGAALKLAERNQNLQLISLDMLFY